MKVILSNKVQLLFDFVYSRPSSITAKETKAQQYVQQGDVDLALLTYQHIQPMTARILNKMGELCTVKKGDYDYALQCHQQALNMQTEVL
jgi:Tfp pilus assembly protein PilF